MSTNIDAQALQEMLTYLLQKVESGELGGESKEGEEMPAEEGLGEEIGDIAEDVIDDEYIKPENRDVRLMKHQRPKKMEFSLSELAIKGAPKKEMPMMEEEQEDFNFKKRNRGRR